MFTSDLISQTIETFTTVQNPNPVPVEVRISYLPGISGSLVHTLTDTIAANSRATYNMAHNLAGGRRSVMVECLTAGQKIMVERSMYFQNRWGGTDTIGGYSD